MSRFNHVEELKTSSQRQEYGEFLESHSCASIIDLTCMRSSELQTEQHRLITTAYKVILPVKNYSKVTGLLEQL